MSIQTIMTADESGQELVEYAQQVADVLVKNNLTRAQIRNIFTEVRQIEALWGTSQRKEEALRRLSMLKPKLAYQTARTNSLEKLKQVLSEAIDEVVKSPADKKDATFQRFMDLFEAILAYHRALGGRN
jgi:CRISPR-associated protein Csm2